MNSLYESLGEKVISELVTRFYDKVFASEKIGHLFKNDKALILEKQRQFLTQFFGGPTLYTDEHGHPKMRRRHMPHRITQESKEEWLRLMFASIDELDIENKLKETLKGAFPVLAQHMVNS